MIPSILLQGLFSKVFQGGLPLDKGGEKTANGFAGVLGRLTAGGEGPNTKSLLKKPSLAGHSFLSQLKKEFMAFGRPLEEYKVSGNAAAHFGDILVKLGFDTGEVEQMLSSLGGGDTGRELTIADLFTAASQLTEPGGDEIPPVTLDGSALPDLEIILQNLGLNPETSRRILSDALTEKSGIDLKTLASGIRRVLGDIAAEPGIDMGNQDGIIERMKRIGLSANGKPSLRDILDELISELEDLNEARGISEEGVEADGLPGSLLLSYLQQLVQPLGNEGRSLQQLIASAGKENGGVDVRALLNRLVKMKQETSSLSPNYETAGNVDAQAGALESGRMGLFRFVSSGVSDAYVGASGSGKMSLREFVSILESRIAAEESSGGAFKAGSDQRPMAEVLGNFMKTVSASAENTSGKQPVFQVDFEGGKPSESNWQPGSKAVADVGNSQSAGKAFTEAGTKEAAGQQAAQVSRSSTLPGEGDRSFSENAAGREQTERLSQALNTAGRSKANKFADDNGFNLETAVREAKSGEETAPPVRAAANRSLPGYLLNQVSRQILRLRSTGENEMTLQLKPPHLGRMKLTMEHTAGGMKVGIIVESAAAKDMLLANTGDLKTALADQGLRLDRIDVEARADFGQSMAQAGREFGRSGQQKGRWAGRNPGSTSGVSETPAGTGAAAGEVGAGRLNLVA
jgi:flagellar hook-length control protein FliK